MEPRIVGGYRLERRIGGGAMGQVWLGRHNLTNGIAAIKLLRDNAKERERVREFFIREGRTIARLSHPNIVPFYDTGPGFLVTAHIQGMDLRRRLRSPLSPALALRIARQIASALAHAHENGVVHRDVKPSNILLDTDDNAYLADFGLADVADDLQDVLGDARVGTPSFMAPEQVSNRNAGPAADQYALGRTVLVMFHGSDLPLAHDDALDCLPDRAPAELRDVLSRATEPDQSKRWPSMRAFEQALATIESEDITTEVKLATEQRVREPFRWVTAAHATTKLGIDIVRADYRLSDLVDAGVVDGEAVAEFKRRSGYKRFGWSLYACENRLGPITDPSALARASDLVVMLHGFAADRESWSWTATQLCRRNAQIAILVPDINGFGETEFAAKIPTADKLMPRALIRSTLRWLDLLGVAELPSVLVAHSASAMALLTATDDELGPRTTRVAIAPVLPWEDAVIRRKLLVSALLMDTVGRARWLLRPAAGFFIRHAPETRGYGEEVIDYMVEQLISIPPRTFAALIRCFASAQPAAGRDLRNCTVIVGNDDPLAPAEIVRRGLAKLDFPTHQIHTYGTGGHFPHGRLQNHPEWTARNVDEMVAIIDSMLSTSSQGTMMSTQIASTMVGSSDEDGNLAIGSNDDADSHRD